jgi:hypothetical protein
VAGLIASAAIVSGELILGLDDGSLIRVGYVQGPQGLQGIPGPIGATGKPGQDGNGLLHGAGFPTPEDGRDGDFYIDVTKMAVFGPKTGGVWGKPVYLRPEDNNTTQLGKPISSSPAQRSFAAAMGGGGSGSAPTTSAATGGLTPILDNELPLAKNVTKLVAEDKVGDAMVVDLWAQGPQGTLFTEVAISKGTGTDSGFAVVYDIRMGAVPPTLTFTPAVSATGALQLIISSDVDLSTLRGRVIFL